MAGTITSGNYGHLGRPGHVGGSIATRRSPEERETDPRHKLRQQPLCPTPEELTAEKNPLVGKKKKMNKAEKAQEKKKQRAHVAAHVALARKL